MSRGLALVAVAALGLAGCAEHVYAPETEVATRAWVEPGPPTLTLVTVIGNRDGHGGHSALVVSGSQRVVFDPAGSWHHPLAPERGDVLFGMTPTMLDYFVDYHARPAYRVVLQEVAVAPETAERALALVRAHGAARRAHCGVAVSGILREVGFAEVGRSWFPDRIMRDFAAVPGVEESVVTDDVEDPWAPERPAARFDADGNLVQPGT